MEINLGNNFGGNMGVMPETRDVGVEGARRETMETSKASRPTTNLSIGEGGIGLPSSEPTADVSAATLRRDDDLGKLVNSVFCLPPPAMPTFSD